MAKRCFMLVHHNDEITNTEERATFYSQNPVSVSLSSSITLLELQNTILRKLGQLNRKQITQMIYRLPTTFGQGVVRYTSLPVGSNNDVSLMEFWWLGLSMKRWLGFGIEMWLGPIINYALVFYSIA